MQPLNTDQQTKRKGFFLWIKVIQVIFQMQPHDKFPTLWAQHSLEKQVMLLTCKISADEVYQPHRLKLRLEASGPAQHVQSCHAWPPRLTHHVLLTSPAPLLNQNEGNQPSLPHKFARVDPWMAPQANFQKKEKEPILLNIHNAPLTAYAVFHFILTTRLRFLLWGNEA